MDITKYAAKPESYDRLSTAQIRNFFQKHEAITKDDCDSIASMLLDSPVSSTPVQGATSYTLEADRVPKVVYRTYKLRPKVLELARQSYGGFVPGFVEHGMFGPAHVYEWDLVRGQAFCRVRRRFLAPGMEILLQRTVEDFEAWNNQPVTVIEAPPNLLDEYNQTLDTISQTTPQRFLPKIDEIRGALPLLFRHEYPMVVQHDDLLENNIHVDEHTGGITGIVDWQDAIIAPFGVSLASLEVVLGVQTWSTWHLHHDHIRLRERFWDAFYGEVG
ncbi:hypothetical protein BU24DRAFT_457759 [Aaosphaeria arxii CBS 175.79]|uniref:Aminoglycoside phosphotransferase domain-containing protein n=1 Tax=Aaosphaeria arxii CBS 175.79 TaxID=1450172 RepID=A0A6A5YAW3_9PLEO|nr:uncharacterized protein BU24DRAFT_457759 [Aaosphaeria arxii CBS 175.79]KAF2021831.1 hypothetical protein BU24DRAFT_457759 [Aaosphaeria arxii CBS 175.79]